MASPNAELLESVKKDVRSVLITESKGMVLSAFLKIFRELTTQYLPFGRLGFKTAEQFVLAATDVCKCERTASGELLLLPVCDDTTSHVRKMVEKSRRPRTSARVCQGAASTGGGFQRGRRDLAKSRPRAPVSAPAEVRRTALELLSLHPQGIHVDQFNLEHRKHFGHAIAFISLGFSSMQGLLESLGAAARLKQTATGPRVFPVQAKGVGTPPAGGAVPVSAAPAAAAGTPPTPTSPLRPQPPDRGPLLPTPSSLQLDPAPTPPSVPRCPQPGDFLSHDHSMKELSEALHTLLVKHNGPVNVINLRELYRRERGHNLELHEYGFSSVMQALTHLGAPFHLSKRNDDWIVALRPPKSSPSKPTNGHLPHRSAPPRGAGLNSSGGGGGDGVGVTSSRAADVPVDGGRGGGDSGAAMPRFTTGALHWLEADGTQATTQTGFPLLEVVVTHVVSPGEFYFCPVTALGLVEEMALQLEDMCPPAWRLLPPAEPLLTTCRPLAAYTKQGWRRALLVGRVFDQVKVLLVDTGVMETLPLDSVQLLPPELVRTPVQCFQGVLANLEPTGTKWSEQALRMFRQLTTLPAPLMAIVLRQTEFSSELLLCDTSGDEDRHVGDELMVAGHARMQDAVPDTKPAPLRITTLRMLGNLYHLLDQGAPSASQRTPPRVDATPGIETPPPTPAVSNNQMPPLVHGPTSPRLVDLRSAACASATPRAPAQGTSSQEPRLTEPISPPAHQTLTGAAKVATSARSQTQPQLVSVHASAVNNGPAVSSVLVDPSLSETVKQVPRVVAASYPDAQSRQTSALPVANHSVPAESPSPRDSNQEELNRLKAECYDLMKLQLVARPAAKRAALLARLSRLEAEVARLETSDVDGAGAASCSSEA